MSGYQLTWLTDAVALGSAPMSYADLDAIKEAGVDAIVNLCAEFCDLHEIEEKSAFQVHYLSVPDENAPDMEGTEKALAWLDGAVHRGKKVLVHCRFGVGRTGTFGAAYLLRQGFSLKEASKRLRRTGSVPTSYSQWRFLRKYAKKLRTGSGVPRDSKVAEKGD